MQRRQRRLLMTFVFSALVGLVFFHIIRGQVPPVETDPLRVRAESAAALGGELASLARSQLDNLLPPDREVVEQQVLRLEQSTVAVRSFLKERAKEETLLPALISLESILGEIVVPAKTELPKEGGAVP